MRHLIIIAPLALAMSACSITDHAKDRQAFLGNLAPTNQSTPSTPTAPSTTGTQSAKPSINAHTTAATTVQFLSAKNVVQKTADGKLLLSPAEWSGSSNGNSGYDAGMNGLKTGAITNQVFAGKSGYFDGGLQAYLIDPKAAGFEHQTFGQVFDGMTSKGYVSVGTTFTPSDTANINATYKGGAMGTFDGKSEVVSDLTAHLKWGAEKSLQIVTSNSKISANNIETGDYTPLANDSRFNINQTLQWDKNQGKFTNANGSAGYLYGVTEVSEVGGTINQTIDGKAYQGGFGAKKQ